MAPAESYLQFTTRVGSCGAVLLLFCTFNLNATTFSPRIEVDDDFESLQIERPLVVTKNAVVTAENVLNETMEAAKLGQTPLKGGQAFWQRLDLHSTARQPVQLTVRYEYPWTDQAIFFTFDEKNNLLAETLGGDSVKGLRKHRIPQISFMLKPHEDRIVLIKIMTALHTAPGLSIYAERAHQKTVFRELIIYGLFTGILAILLIFHTNLYLATRDGILRRYLLYLFTIGIFIPLRSGLIPQKLLGEYAYLSNQFWVILVCLSYFTGLSFARSLLALKDNLPKMDKTIQVVQYACFFPGLALIMGKSEAMLLENLTGLVVGPPLLLLGIYHAIFKVRSSYYFVAGYSLPIGAAIIDNLVENGIVRSFTGRNEMLPLAIAAEFLLFSLVVYRKLSDLALERARVQKNLSRFQTELAYARMIQRQLLPELRHNIKGCEIQAYYQPRLEVGGDYFDVVEPDDHSLGLLVTSGTGYGLAAALDASAVRMAFRNSFKGEIHPDQVLRQTHKLIGTNLQGRTVSGAYLIFNELTGKGQFCSAGNPPLLIVRRHGELEMVQSATPALGVTGTEENLTAQDFILHPDDALMLFTKGLMRNSRKSLADHSARYLLKRINARLLDTQHVTPAGKLRGHKRLRGDVTILLLRFRRGSALP